MKFVVNGKMGVGRAGWEWELSYAPDGAGALSGRVHRAHALGYFLTPLRGWGFDAVLQRRRGSKMGLDPAGKGVCATGGDENGRPSDGPVMADSLDFMLR